MFKPTKPQHITNKGYFDSKIPEPPTQDGVYAFRCIVSDGVVTYSWSRESSVHATPSTDQEEDNN